MSYTRKSGFTRNVSFKSQHRFEHWYRDNQIYFITARCRDRFPAFHSKEAQSIFWDRFTFYAQQHQFTPIITTLLNNHYHTLGYLKIGIELGPMMQKFHGSVAKLVNDLLPARLQPFWHDGKNRNYFDGCIRNEKQFRLAYRYTQTQARRAGLPQPWQGTKAHVGLEVALRRALDLKAFLQDVRYKRYEQR